MPDNPLFKKLRILPGTRVLVLHSPPGYLPSLGEFPAGATVETQLTGQYDLVHAFFTNMQELEDQVQDLKSALVEDGILWISYPKGSAKKETDLNRDILYKTLAGRGLKAVFQVSVDDTWSAMRFKES